MHVSLLGCFVCCFVTISQCQDNVETNPETNSATPEVYVAPEEGETNVLLQCFQYTNEDKLIQQVTPWRIQRSSIDTTLENLIFHPNLSISNPPDLVDDIVVTGNIVFNLVARNNFTILNFTNQFDTTTLQCGAASNSRTFILGFPVAPSIRDDPGVQSIIEADGTIMVNMTSLSSSNTAFPPQLSFQWIFNGKNITDNSMITINDYIITFTDVQRNASGIYTLRISNTARTTTASFELDVLFLAEAVSVLSEPLIVLTGTSSVTLKSPIDGNPFPNVTWTGPDGSPITTNDKYNISGIPGQLVITNIIASDNGTYTSTASNGIGQSLIQSVDLILADGAGPPMAVIASDVTDTSVTINWSPPDYLGVPQLSYYQLTLVPSSSMDVIITANTTTLVVNDLLPNTVYNISIVAVSTGDSFDILLGDQSNIITITTLTGAPLISDANGISINGSILISWSLVHTGGLPIDQYQLYCNVDQHDNGEVESDRISKILLCQMNECSDDELSGSSVLGTVMIGTVYSCSISVMNDEGIDSRLINNITVHEQGLPSVPVVLSSNVINNDILSLIISVTYAGNINGSFRMIVDVYRQMTMDEQSYYNRYIYNYPMYNDRGNVTVNISGLNPGIYTLVITSSNRFGESINKGTVQAMINKSTDISSVLSSCYVSTITLLPSTSNCVTVVSNTSDSIVIGSSIGIAIIFIIAIVELVILLVIVFYRRRGNKGTDNNLSVKPHPPPMYDVVEVKSTTIDQSSLQTIVISLLELMKHTEN